MICFARDAYDEAVEYLRGRPEAIPVAWSCPDDGPAGMLFRVTGRDRRFGCLTQIRLHKEVIAPTPELTALIKNDKRIPTHPTRITPAHLPIFAIYQRQLDAELGREPPVMKE